MFVQDYDELRSSNLKMLYQCCRFCVEYDLGTILDLKGCASAGRKTDLICLFSSNQLSILAQTEANSKALKLLDLKAANFKHLFVFSDNRNGLSGV